MPYGLQVQLPEAILESVIPEGALGIDYALTAMFIALLVFQLRNPLVIVLSILSGLLSLIFSLLLPGAWNIILASMVAASAGVSITYAFRRRKKV